MKIGIITWFRTGNYGTNIQAIALYNYLSRKHEVAFISYFDYTKLFSKNLKTRILYKIRVFIRYLLKPFLYYKRIFGCNNLQKGLKIQKFFRKLKIIEVISWKSLESFDSYITGSDQIWNPYYIRPFYMLDFVPDNIPRFSYSSSMGVDSIPIEKEEIYIKNLSKFKNIAVREKTGELLLKNLLQRNDVRTVMDPVFLLTNSEWMNLIHTRTINEKYIFCYFVGSRIDNSEAINHIRNITGVKKIIYVPSQEYPKIKLDGFCDKAAGNDEFLSYIANASLICTDSFHATALSLIFNRQFIEFKRFAEDDKKSQNSRITDLLAEYGLSSRIYNDNFNFSPIDYSLINEKLKNQIDDSKKYLEQILTGGIL